MTQKAHDASETSHPGRLIGYARVSTTSQNLDVQLRALTEAGVPAQLVITDKISGTTTPAGRFQLNVFVAMAEYQRALIVERVQDGLEAARARGMQLGRKSPITPEQVHAIHRLHRAGLSHCKIHRRVGVSKGAVGRVLRGEIKSLAHVSLELPEDEIDVWDAETNHAMRSAPTAEQED